MFPNFCFWVKVILETVATMLNMTIKDFLHSSGGIAIAARASFIIGLMWSIVQVADRFNLFEAPKTIIGFALMSLSAVCAILAVEHAVILINRNSVILSNTVKISPEKSFAQSVVAYARALGETNRDEAVIALRAWATRFLHLGALLTERIQLGETALRSAMAKGDQATQASILMDDLGWTVHESGDSILGLANIDEAIGVLDREVARQGIDTREELVALKVKAMRHRANVIASLGNTDLSVSRNAFAAPRLLSAKLSDPLRILNLAQLDHSEAQVISLWLNRGLGTGGKVDPTGVNAKLLTEATALAEQAEKSFRAAGDEERETKALKLLCDLLSRAAARQPALEANERLVRLQQRVARNIDRRTLKNQLPNSEVASL